MQISAFPNAVALKPYSQKQSDTAGQAAANPANSSQPSALVAGPGTSPAVDPVQLNSELLTALMNSPQGRTDDNYRLSPEGIGKPGPKEYFVGSRPAVAGGIMQFYDGNGPYLDTQQLQGQDASAIAKDLIEQFGSGDSLSLDQVEHAYQVDDPSVNSGYRESMKKLLEADWNVLSGGSSKMSLEQLTSAIDKYVTNNTTDTPDHWGAVSSDTSNQLSRTQLAAAIQSFSAAQDIGVQEKARQVADLLT